MTTGTGSPPKARRVRLIVAWYDLWVGAYYDRQRRHLYVFPVPCVGVCIEFRPRHVRLIVTSAGSQKIHAIKEIRAATRLGLIEAKAASEGAGLTLEAGVGLPLAEALEGLGAAVTVERV